MGVRVLSCLFALLLPPFAAWAEPDAPALYAERCAACHGEGRLGGIGPALLPENLGYLKPEGARAVIAAGRAATQMPGFKDELDAGEIEALAAYVFGPLPEVPAWGAAEIAASRTVFAEPEDLPDRPAFAADPLNLFVLVESGDHHVSVIDGDSLERIDRFPSRFALHGGPKFSPDGRFVHFASRDGWITRYDLWSLRPVAEVRAGINTRNIAISGDGRILAVANTLPRTLVLLDAGTLEPLKVIEAKDIWKKKSSRVSAVYTAPTRRSFVVALKDLPEVWEVSYADPPPKSFGFVHSHEAGMEEALDAGERFPIRRTVLEAPIDDFFFDPTYTHLIGASGDGAAVVDLDVRRAIKKLPLLGLPHLGSGISWMRDGHRVMATPHLKEAAVSVIDMDTWEPIKRLETPGPGFFMRGHENSPYVWVDSFLGGRRDTVSVIDKETLEIVREITPSPGKTAAHVEFTRDGRYALLSVWDMDGAVVVYDAGTLEEVKRIPAVKPSGKYNVWNKITFSEGTSH
ncbi:MAG: c-type cytochrome [Geminicoccaceae bacterium]|nr:c-type cytochrome [Geminicoccaceae bacterium]